MGFGIFSVVAVHKEPLLLKTDNRVLEETMNSPKHLLLFLSLLLITKII
jgi:hypothetical protein